MVTKDYEDLVGTYGARKITRIGDCDPQMSPQPLTSLEVTIASTYCKQQPSRHDRFASFLRWKRGHVAIWRRSKSNCDMKWRNHSKSNPHLVLATKPKTRKFMGVEKLKKVS